ncbi:MAG: hypothetical protein D6715_05770 [Calditrichaeota bacterium]|nr:MAG: hypothetical protein D6715_05770 [Calditrichota bacterium]
MKRLIVLTLFLIMLCVQLASAQMDTQVGRDLDRLQTLLNRVRTLSSVIQNADLRDQFNRLIQEIESELRTARQLARDRKWELARVHIRAAFQKLNLLERKLRNHPGIRIRFKEEADRKIHQAELALRGSQNEQALRMLERARFFRNKAFQLARSDNPFAALEYYRMAIFFAQKAIELTGPVNRDRASDARGLLQELELLYRRAEQLVSQNPEPQLNQMFAAASRSYRKIRRLIDAHEWTQAAQQARALTHLLYRIIDLGERIPQNEDFRIAENLGRLENQINALGNDPALTKRPQARALLERARRFVSQAKQLMVKNRLRLARQKLLFASRLLVKLEQLRRADQIDPEVRVKNEITRARATLQELSQSMDQHRFADFRRLIEQNLSQAESFAAQRQYSQALQSLKVVKLMMLKLNNLMLLEDSRSVQALGARAVIERLEQLVTKLEGEGEASGIEAFRLQNARRLLELARQAGATNRWALADQYAQLGISILTR